MAGLLDFVNTPEGQGLLSAAFGGLAGARRGQPVNSLGRAGLAGLAGYSGAQDREMQMAENAKQNELRTMQMDAYKQNITAAQRKAAEEQRIKDLVAAEFAPVTGTNANAVSGVMGPRPEAAAVIGQAPARPNYQRLIAMGVPAEMAKSLAEAENYGRTKVARTVKGMGPDGREFEYQVDDYGQRVGEGLAQYKAPIQADTGGAVQFLDPYTQKPVSSLAKTLSPDAKASNALGWANNAVSRERLNLDRGGYTFSAELGGYVPKAPGGQFVPLTGGPGAGAAKLTESEGKNTLYLSQMRDASNTLDTLEKDGKTVSPALVAATGSPYTNWMAGKTSQQVGQTQRQWAEAYLRAKTGAAATAGEVENNIRTYFPVVGDDAATIKQKREARSQAERDMEIPAGRGADRATPRKPPEQTKAVKRTGTVNGRKVVEYADGSVEYAD
jgi:hypothetical protein